MTEYVRNFYQNVCANCKKNCSIMCVIENVKFDNANKGTAYYTCNKFEEVPE